MSVYNLVDVFERKYSGEGDLQAFIEDSLTLGAPVAVLRPGMRKKSHMNRRIDLEGKCFVINSPLKLRGIDGAIISNGCIVAGPDFPEGEYLIDIVGANTLKIENLILECSKRANGIFVNKFIRVRIEDCTILHQRSFGVYANEKGANHELEVVKCNIMEYVWGDGAPKSNNYGIIPDYKEGGNRTSVGVFLGQADNVVADCNINLCKVGIRVGMRANRIQGNHITAGGANGNDLYNCIEVNKGVRSACLIVNNYIDNGRLYIQTSQKPISKRNYLTVTDNLFYRGFNHPEGEEFNHIVVDPADPDSTFANVIISSNQFYNQDENLAKGQVRKIRPIKVLNNDDRWVDPKQVSGSLMSSNSFTYDGGYQVVPMGTEITKQVAFSSGATTNRYVDFSELVPWGEIRTAQIVSGNESFNGEVKVSKIVGNKVVLDFNSEEDGIVYLKVSVASSYDSLDYIVH